MAEHTVDFDAEYNDALIDDAAKVFVQRLFRKYLWLLITTCVINILGFATVLIYLGATDWMTIAVGVVAMLGPIYFPWQYYRLPGELSARMKKGLGLVRNVRVSLTPSTFTLTAKGGSFTSDWTKLKAIEEFPDYFLLVAGLLVFTFIPRRNMPLDALQLVRDAATTAVQPNPSMQPTGQQRPAAD